MPRPTPRWNLPGGAYHTVHDYEQHTLQWRLVHLHNFRPRLRTLHLQSMAVELDSRGWPQYSHAIAHIDHGRNFYRSAAATCALHTASLLLVRCYMRTAHRLTVRLLAMGTCSVLPTCNLHLPNSFLAHFNLAPLHSLNTTTHIFTQRLTFSEVLTQESFLLVSSRYDSPFITIPPYHQR